MHILVLGVNQTSAPLAVRERLTVAPAALPATLARLRAHAAEVLVLSTCNRVEVYAAVDDPEQAAPGLLAGLAGTRDLPTALLAPHLYRHIDAAAAHHLFGVAAGLDSLVVGEDQILAQLKGALAAAQAARTAGPYVHRLAHMALTAGKHARARTAIGRHHLSVVSVALRLAAGRLGDLGAQGVLVVGGGQTAELALKHLVGRPAALLVANRTAARGAALAAAYGAVAYPWDALEDAVAAADVVVSATSAPGPVLDAPLVARAHARRPGRPLLLLDLALPRDVDPACAALPGVGVADLDSLQAIAAENRRRRAGEIAQAETIIAEAVERFAAWWRARAAVPAIVALRRHAEAVRDAEVARTLARLPDLTPEEADAVRYLATALVNKLMHGPTTALKAAPADARLAAALHTLFALPDTADAASAGPAVDRPGNAAAVWVPAGGHADDREELHP